jgi:hypothetical protein
MKKVLLIAVMVCVCAMAMGGIEKASAANYVCSVVQAGMTSGAAYIYLTDTAATPAFTNRYFLLDPTAQNQLLAIALTALANSKLIVTNFPGAPTAGNKIVYMYVNQ